MTLVERLRSVQRGSHTHEPTLDRDAADAIELLAEALLELREKVFMIRGGRAPVEWVPEFIDTVLARVGGIGGEVSDTKKDIERAYKTARAYAGNDNTSAMSLANMQVRYETAHREELVKAFVAGWYAHARLGGENK